MVKGAEKEYFVAFVGLVVLALLLTGFYFAWSAKQEQAPTVVYGTFNDIVVNNEIYAIKTNIAVQTASKDEPWLTRNKASIGNVLKSTLSNAELDVVTSANRLQVLQESMKKTANLEFKTNAIQNVFFTDFIIVMTDSQ